MPPGLSHSRPTPADSPLLAFAALTSAAVVSFDMAGRATRDALFLSTFGPSRLPTMVFLGSATALCVGVLAARLMARTLFPARLLARALLTSALLLIIEWALARRFAPAVAVLVYLHFTGASGLFISGFWTVVSERFDPGTARRSIARIAAAGTVGGLLGGLLTGWVGAASTTASMLPLLAVLNVGAALTLQRLSSPREPELEPVNAVLQLRREALEREPLAFSSSPAEDRVQVSGALEEYLAQGTKAIFGAFEPALVGMVGIAQEEGAKSRHKARLWGVYVTPAHRGAGIGRALVDAAIEFARDLDGVTHVHLSVAETGHAAQALYERLGFRTWGTEPVAIRVGDMSVAEHHMILRVIE